MPLFTYGAAETEYLKQRDPLLGEVIDLVGPVERSVNPDLFEALVNSIVGQQISTRAQTTIWNRMKAAHPKITPELAAQLPAEEIQQFGISFRKVEYIKDTAGKILSGELDLGTLSVMSDEEVCRVLSSLRGIGVWTAEMLLLFSMGRPDVVSYGDLAIHRGMRMLYRHRVITPKLFQKYRRRYAPYGSTASLYLWAVAGGAVPGLTDPGEKRKK